MRIRVRVSVSVSVCVSDLAEAVLATPDRCWHPSSCRQMT